MALQVRLLVLHTQIFRVITTHRTRRLSTGMAEDMEGRRPLLIHMVRMLLVGGDMEDLLQDVGEVDLAEADLAEATAPKILTDKIAAMVPRHKIRMPQTLALLVLQLVDTVVLSQIASTQITRTTPNDPSLRNPKDNTLPTLHVHLTVDAVIRIDLIQATITNNRDAWHPRR
jgi:hypothetical protein